MKSLALNNEENRLISVCKNWDRYDFKALLRLVKSFILSIWDTRKNKLYDDQDSETSGCSCSCPLTGVLTNSACVCGCMWSMASVLRQQHEYFILMQEPTKKPLHPLHLFFLFQSTVPLCTYADLYHCT